jgi:PhnB protein
MTQPDPFAAPLAPYLTIDGAAAAIDFYKAAFGAEELFRAPAPDGDRVFHASLLINGALVYLSDDFPDMNEGARRDPKSLGGTPVTIHLHMPEGIDEAWERAIIAGATVVMPLEKQEWGERYGALEDPFGHRWSMAEPASEE